MAINTWFSPEQRRYIDTRKAIRQADQQERKRAQDAAERAELWAWYEGYDVSDSFAAAQRARDAVAAQELREAMKSELLAVEMDQAASETSDALNQVKPK